MSFQFPIKERAFLKDFLIIPVISPELSDNNFPYLSCISAAAGRKVL